MEKKMSEPNIKFREFHNALRIMTNIDRDELERAGIIAASERKRPSGTASSFSTKASARSLSNI